MIKMDMLENHTTKYEKARLIGARALQLSMGAPFLVKMNNDDLKKINYNPIEIAKLEFKAGVLPMEIKRLKPHEKNPVIK